MSIASRLREARGNTPRSEVAEAVGITVSAISMYENGNRVPRDEVKIKLARYYGVSIQDIFFDEECHESRQLIKA